MRRIPGKSEAESEYLRRQQQQARNRKKTLKVYGLDPEQFEWMRQRQRNRCAICLQPFGDETPRVDHDHATGRTRELLHDRCNRGLSCFREDIDSFIRAAAYLEKHGTKRRPPLSDMLD